MRSAASEELVGRTHWEMFPASVGTEAERQYRRVVAEQVEAHFAHHYVGEGYDRHVEIDAYPTEEGGVAVFWREVSARVHAEAELRARNEQLAEQALELETANQQLQDGATELEARTEEAERARAVADEAARRLAFLAEATTRLASSLDYEATLGQIVALAVPHVADWAAYTVDGGDGTLRMVAIHHAGPDRTASAREIARRCPIRADEPAGAAQVLRTGVPELIADIPDDMLQRVARDAEHLELLRSAGFRFTSVNAAMERSVGASRDALLGQSIWDAFPGTPGTVFERSCRQVAREREEVHFVGEYAADGLELVPEVDAYPAAAGGVAVFWRDIAPRRRMEAALAESERQLRTLADAIPTLAWTATSTGTTRAGTSIPARPRRRWRGGAGRPSTTPGSCRESWSGGRPRSRRGRPSS